jgi:hypothetical protein
MLNRPVNIQAIRGNRYEESILSITEIEIIGY